MDFKKLKKADNFRVLFLINLLFFCLYHTGTTQHLDVEGHSRIRGNLDINHMDDTTSVYIGRNAGILSFNDTTYNNTFVGSNSGIKNTSGSSNIFVGSFSGYSNTTGYGNTFAGRTAGFYNEDGYYNSFFGNACGVNNTCGTHNSFFGAASGSLNQNGNLNVYIGNSSGGQMTGGSGNTYLGTNSGSDIMQGDSNICIGIGAGPDSNVSHQLYIDVKTSFEPLIYGEFDNGLVTIHHPTPDHSVNAGFRIKNTDSNKHFWNLGVSNTDGGDLFLYSSNGGLAGCFDDVTGAYTPISDRRKKTNICELSDVLSLLRKIQIREYQMLPLNNAGHEKQSDAKRIGVIAQELKELFPQFVYYNQDLDIFRVDYAGLSTLAIKAVQEIVEESKLEKERLNKIIKEQGDHLAKLDKEMNKLRQLLLEEHRFVTDK